MLQITVKKTVGRVNTNLYYSSNLTDWIVFPPTKDYVGVAPPFLKGLTMDAICSRPLFAMSG